MQARAIHSVAFVSLPLPVSQRVVRRKRERQGNQEFWSAQEELTNEIEGISVSVRGTKKWERGGKKRERSRVDE